MVTGMSELKKVQRSIGIVHRYHALSAYPDFVRNEKIAETFSDLGKNGRFQREFKGGVGQLEIRWDHAAHAICIVLEKILKIQNSISV